VAGLRRRLTHCTVVAAAFWGCLCQAEDLGPPLIENPQAQAFVADMSSQHDFNQAELEALFSEARLRPSVIERITRPAEGKPWYEYREIFLVERRIAGGAAFWRDHAQTLVRAEATYGVPAEVIVAILGVETFYGQYRGKDPVLESVATLAFDYPKRADFFRSELEQFLLLTREQDFDPMEIKGSYAGAMGWPQFISSSYRHYAVDFDGDGRKDLLNSPTDAIGSIANYLSRHGWKRGETVAAPARVEGSGYGPLVKKGMKPKTPVGQLSAAGVYATTPVRAQQAAVLRMEGKRGAEYWLGFDNFYAITRYNHSALYALAAYQLSGEIRDRYLAPVKPLISVDQAQTAKLQRLLLDRGYDPGPIDGRSGPMTKAALARFRADAGVPSDSGTKRLLLALAQ